MLMKQHGSWKASSVVLTTSLAYEDISGEVFASEDQAVYFFPPRHLAWNVNIVLPLCLCVPLQSILCAVTVPQCLSSMIIIFRLAKITRV